MRKRNSRLRLRRKKSNVGSKRRQTDRLMRSFFANRRQKR
jgi:hypothetical protein